MRLRTLVIVIVALLLALFVSVNWTAFMTPATVSLVFGAVQAPLGLVMLLITGLVAALFLAYALWLQRAALLETRRMTRELAAQRQLAEQAETSEQAANLRARAELMQQIAAIVKKNRWTQTEAAQRCGITQPRMNDLLRGRVSRFSLDALVNIATAIGRRVHMELESV